MRYFPLFHDTQNLSLLVIGGGEVAARKIALWARTEAQITLVAPTWVASIQALNGQRIECHKEHYHTRWLAGNDGVIVATDDPILNQRIAQEAQLAKLWVNVVDQPELCTVITPAIVDRSPLVVAIGSEGSAPVLVRTLRALIETRLSQTVGQLAQFIGQNRSRIARQHPNPRSIWDRFIAGNGMEFNEQTEALLEVAEQGDTLQGAIWLMSEARHPGLLPIAALAQLQRLDRVLSLQAISPLLLELVRRDASPQLITEADLPQICDWYQQGEQLLMVIPTAQMAVWQQSMLQLNIEVKDPFVPSLLTSELNG